MSFNDVIMWIVAIGVVIGGLDKLLGNKFGLGEKFEEGYHAFGGLALAMAGVVVLAPVLAKWMIPVLGPVFGLAKIDLAMAGSLIANDMGGYSMAMSLAQDYQIGLMSGCVTASMLGCTLVFSIPVGLGMINKEDEEYFIQGIIVGLITVPIGSIVGGLVAGFDAGKVLWNNIPIIILSLLLAVGIKKKPELMIKIVAGFGTFIGWVAVIGAMIGTFTYLTGVTIPLFVDAEDMMEAMKVVAAITLVLSGILPMLELFRRGAYKALSRIGRLMKIDAVSTSGLIFNLANPVPVFQMIKDMNKRGKVINTAWIVTATAALGDHLGFTAGVQPDMITPMIVGKLSAGVCAIIIACIMTRDWDE